MKKLFAPLGKLALFSLRVAVTVGVVALLAGAIAASKGPPLEAWHTLELENEFRTGLGIDSLESYLELEGKLFLELEERLVDQLSGDRLGALNRFDRTSPSWPARGSVNFNRTQIYRPARPRGGVLLLHGMTDSPYSLRAAMSIFEQRDFYVVNLRLPGHGTTPGELARIDWRDWAAATRLAAEHIQQQIGPDLPFYMVGYSNGASLALNFSLDTLESTELRTPDHLFLLSPMLGVSGLAAVGRLYYWISKLGVFEKAAWLDLIPEYDPHKYNSFPMNGPRQSLAMTRRVDDRLNRLQSTDALEEMPPVLAFQSLVDSTVLTSAVLDVLFRRLPANGSRLVLFDVNRAGILDDFVHEANNRFLERLKNLGASRFSVDVLTNQADFSRGIQRVTRVAGQEEIERLDTGLRWPAEFWSLTHVALPFKPDDPVYGFLEPEDQPSPPFPGIGRVRMMGENGALTLPASLFTRARSNPFWSLIRQDIEHQLDAVHGEG